MRIIKSFIVAFSMYSRIPMPRFTWDSEDMKYHLIFFPWIGAVIGLLEYGLLLLTEKYGFPNAAFAALAIAIPLIVTGGFHLDGFMDVEDAISSFKTREERLEILKDPHIGAFSVINVIIVGLLLFASILIMDRESFIIWSFSFFMARALSGMLVVKGKKAKSEGMLYSEAKNTSDKPVFVILCIELIMSFCLAFIVSAFRAVYAFIIPIVTVYMLQKRANRLFGGITGDVAGWYVVNAEFLAALFLALFKFF